MIRLIPHFGDPIDPFGNAVDEDGIGIRVGHSVGSSLRRAASLTWATRRPKARPESSRSSTSEARASRAAAYSDPFDWAFAALSISRARAFVATIASAPVP